MGPKETQQMYIRTCIDTSVIVGISAELPGVNELCVCVCVVHISAMDYCILLGTWYGACGIILYQATRRRRDMLGSVAKVGYEVRTGPRTDKRHFQSPGDLHSMFWPI